ncbi:MAG: DUF6541 family protein [Mycobacterium sp.]
MSSCAGVLLALLLLIVPGALVALVARLTWPVAIAVGPVLTYGIVGLAIIPYGALGIPWNAWTAVLALAIVIAGAYGLRVWFARYRDRDAKEEAVSRGPALAVGAGVALGATLILLAAVRGIPDWQGIPSTWDAVWHANTIRFILDTSDASSNHMGALRNVETREQLYYPSVFHALAALQCQLVGTAPTTAYTLHSVAAASWLFPVSAAVLTWKLVRGRTTGWRSAAAAAAAAALSASFTAVPYVEFDTASMPNLAAFGVAVPTAVLVMSCVAHRDRIPLAVLAVIGIFSVHITGGVVAVTLVTAWWLVDALWHPVPRGRGEATRGERNRRRGSDLLALIAIAVPALLALLPQFVGVLQQAEIITGHEFDTGDGRKKAVFDAIVQHTRHLNDFPIQNMLIALAAAGGIILLVKRIWWPLAVWLLLVVSIVHSSASFRGPVGTVTAVYSDLFYSDPRRLSGVVTLLITPMAGIGLVAAVLLLVAGLRRLVAAPEKVWAATTAVVLAASTIGLAWHYFPRHRFLFGEKYDAAIINAKDLEALEYLTALPGARDTLIGDANTDGTAWMYAISGLRPLWTHYDYPVQQGPGYNRFIFWAYADDADTDPRVAQAVAALDIRYVLVSTPVVRGFVMPDGLVSLDESRSWRKVYDNGEARIYEWTEEAAA